MVGYDDAERLDGGLMLADTAWPASDEIAAPAAPVARSVPIPGVVNLPLRRAYRALARALADAFDAPDRGRGLVRIAVPLVGVEPIDWLAAQSARPALYWRDRDGLRRIAGIGAADRLEVTPGAAPETVVAEAGRRLEAAPEGARYFGGLRFDGHAPVRRPWRDFGAGWLILPRFEVIEDAGRQSFVCNVMPGRDRARAVLAELDALSDAPCAPPLPPLARRECDAPALPGWSDAVRAVTGGIARGEGWRKVVLARRTTLRCAERVSPLGMLRSLAAGTPRCFHFHFDPGGGSAFLGATPEQLFHRVGTTVHSEALAGTRPRGADAAEDRALEAALVNSLKDGQEHGFVDAHVREALAGVTSDLAGEDAVSVLKLASVQHLVRRMRGRLREGCGDAALMAALHPTPAVCGDPPEAAVARIRALEPFDRGWYAGPVGYVGRAESRFAVGIRSAVVDGRSVSLFTGAGVVEGSHPRDEWRELEAKLRGIWTGPLV